MRWLAKFAFVLALVSQGARAQVPLEPTPESESYPALAADEDAQLSLAGFRGYLERIRSTDEVLYAALEPRLSHLEERELTADVIFGVGTGLGIALAVAAIPVYVALDDEDDLTIGLVAAGVGTFVLGVIIQAIVRPGQSDFMALIDQHDELVGRR